MSNMTLDDMTETRKVLESHGELVVAEMKDILISKGRDASGALVNSISYKIVDTVSGDVSDIGFQFLDYGVYVDQGTKPSKTAKNLPPISVNPWVSVLSPWLKIRGIPQEAAFAIGRKIVTEGLPATNFTEPVDDPSSIKMLAKKLAAATAKDVTRFLQKNRIKQKS